MKQATAIPEYLAMGVSELAAIRARVSLGIAKLQRLDDAWAGHDAVLAESKALRKEAMRLALNARNKATQRQQMTGAEARGYLLQEVALIDASAAALAKSVLYREACEEDWEETIRREMKAWVVRWEKTGGCTLCNGMVYVPTYAWEEQE